MGKRSDGIVRALLHSSDPLSEEACSQLLTIRCESRVLDFKETFNPENTGDWCELVKDLMAMANTGGGYVIIGATDNGADSGSDLTAVASIDQAVIVDKIGKYTDMQPSEINIRHFDNGRNGRVIFHVGASDSPIVFCKPGTYAVSVDRQKTAFSAGTVYFRHGSKSEPARQCDIQRAFDLMFTRRRREILAGVQKVVKAGSDEQVVVLPKSVRLTADPEAPGVRLTDDPNAPPIRGLMGSGKYGSEAEEVAAAVRNLQTDPESYAAQAQLRRFYAHRKQIGDQEGANRCLLVSSMYRHCPPYYWAWRLGLQAAADVCSAEAKNDAYPGIHVTVRLAFTIGGTIGHRILERITAQSNYASARELAKRLLPKITWTWRTWEEYGCRMVTIRMQSVSKQYELSQDDLTQAETLIDKALADEANWNIVKRLDALVYGTRLERQGVEKK